MQDQDLAWQIVGRHHDADAPARPEAGDNLASLDRILDPVPSACWRH